MQKESNRVAVLALNPATWVAEHGNYLFRYACARVHDPALAEDIVQDTFLAALQCCDRFCGQSSERTWLVGILKHKMIDHYRRESRYDQLDHEDGLCAGNDDQPCLRKTRWKQLETLFNSSHGNNADPSTVLEARAFWSVFERCLSCLPPRVACAFILREIERIDPKIICALMGISEGNLWVMIYRARTYLRQSLQVNWLKGRK